MQHRPLTYSTNEAEALGSRPFMAVQVYVPLSLTLTDTRSKTADKDTSVALLPVSAESSLELTLTHVTFGVGRPSASQCRLTSLPSITLEDGSVKTDTDGGSENEKKLS